MRRNVSRGPKSSNNERVPRDPFVSPLRAVLQNRRGSGSIASLLMAHNEAAGPALTTEGKTLKDYVEVFERMLIDNTMRRHKGSIVAVMEELCLLRRTLNEKMAKYGLTRGDYV
jgi:DNA-binding NtrC family response regulator